MPNVLQIDFKSKRRFNLSYFFGVTRTLGLSLLLSMKAFCAPKFSTSLPRTDAPYEINGKALCETAKQTLAYLNRGPQYDPQVIHSGKTLPITLSEVKATLQFICENQTQLNDPTFIKKHFDFIRWQPDVEKIARFSAKKPLLQHLPHDKILMTKYYIHVAQSSSNPTTLTPHAIYALPQEEQHLTLEQANAVPNLIRFHYGKQAILTGALDTKDIPKLAYVSREDLEAALMQGTIIADFGDEVGQKILNVHRNNNIGYDKMKPPYAQDRYWYFKQVDGIKGYGKDSDYKITVNPEVTFAADLTQVGLGKLLMVQYPDASGKTITRAGILADTGGAFVDNLYQVDYLAGAYRGKSAYSQATHQLPDYVDAYFMVLKKS